MTTRKGLAQIHSCCRKCALVLNHRGWLGPDSLSGRSPVRSASRFTAAQIADIIRFRKDSELLYGKKVPLKSGQLLKKAKKNGKQNKISETSTVHTSGENDGELKSSDTKKKSQIQPSIRQLNDEFEDCQERATTSVSTAESNHKLGSSKSMKETRNMVDKKVTEECEQHRYSEGQEDKKIQTNSSEDIGKTKQTNNISAMLQKIAIAEAKDKKKQKLLQDLSAVVDDKSNALLLLSKTWLSGETQNCQDEHIERYHNYIANFSKKNLPSVSTIIGETMSEKSRFFLERWKQEKIEELGEEGFKQLQRATFENGRNLHLCIERYLEGIPYEDILPSDDNQGHWTSLKNILPTCSNVIAKEEMVDHKLLGYRGKFDCIAEHRNTVCVIDWKTSKKPKPKLTDTFDNPLQLAAYAGAINYSGFLLDQKVDVIKNAVLVVCYENGDPGHAHFLDEDTLTHYWKLWLTRLQQFWMQKAKAKGDI